MNIFKKKLFNYYKLLIKNTHLFQNFINKLSNHLLINS